jgi:hypothetical protein
MSELHQGKRKYHAANCRVVNLKAKNGDYISLLSLPIDAVVSEILVKEKRKVRVHRFAYFVKNSIWYKLSYNDAKKLKAGEPAYLLPGKSGRPKKDN